MPAIKPAHIIKTILTIWTSILVLMMPGIAHAQSNAPAKSKSESAAPNDPILKNNFTPSTERPNINPRPQNTEDAQPIKNAQENEIESNSVQGPTSSISTFPSIGSGSGGMTQNSSSGSEPLSPIVEWEKKQNADERLRAFGTDLLGDGIDPHTGTITFEHTDVSLPGNSALDVSIRRRRSQGQLYYKDVDAEFGDWEIVVPRIKAIIPELSPWHTSGARCTNSFATNFPTMRATDPGTNSSAGGGNGLPVDDTTENHEYSSGVQMDIPGFGTQQVLENPITGSQFQPSNAEYVTKNAWYLTCIADIGAANGGGEGFVAVSPSGVTYTFDRYIEHRAKDQGFHNSPAWYNKRYQGSLHATLVTDVNGNTVNYDYDASGRLTQISSSDGRVIDLSYSGASKLIDSVDANGRIWQYGYAQNTYTGNYWEAFSAGGPDNQVLKTVTQPDGKFWQFDLDLMTAGPAPGEQCVTSPKFMGLTHPYGTVGIFVLNDLRHRPSLSYPTYNPLTCAGSGPLNPPDLETEGPPQQVDPRLLTIGTLSVVTKSISHSSLPTSTWNYVYEQDAGPIGSSSSDRTNWTEVTGPDGTKTKYYHRWAMEPGGGSLEQVEIIEAGSSTILQSTSNTYLQESVVGATFIDDLGPVTNPAKPVRNVSSVVSRDGDTFTNTSIFNTDQGSVDYSFGNPTSTSVSSNVSTTPRTTTTTYEHNKTKWVLGLTKTVTTNGRNMASYTYDSLGRKTHQYRYGATIAEAEFTYHTEATYKGTIRQVKDALGRITEAWSWKRGTPQTIHKALGTPDHITVRQFVDDNGWLTSSVDAMNNTTLYTRDSMGRLTLYNPPGSWTNTSISYNFGASNVTQTITKGTGHSEITYDTMFRPTLVKTWASDNSTTPASFVKSTYNGAGQTVFTSFPSTSSNPTAGTNMVYDGLGRIVTSTENVAPLAQTKHEYYSSHLHRVYDPSNNYTDYFSLGFSGPGNEDYRAIYRHGVGGYQQYTYLYKNVWGQMEELRQWGSEAGVSVDKSRYYSFDTQQRLCRYREDEGNSALYAYDAAGQISDYSQGEANAAGCGAMTPAKRTTLYYDALGRNHYTDFWTSGTLDTVKTFDDNSNVLTLKRGQGSGAAGPDTVFHTYTYDTLNNLTSEKLELDGRTYDLGYNYNANGHVTSRTVQSHGASLRTNPYGVDGLGRHTFAKNYGSNAVLDIRYHPNNMIESYDLANNQEFTQTLNARLMPEHITTINGAHKALDMAYLYDVRGKVTSLTDNSTAAQDVRSFTYDPLGQLKTSVGPWGAGSYTYDSLGNIRAKTEGARAMVMSYNNTTNRLTSHTDTVGGSRSLSYDERGNVTALGAQNFVYDLRNQPKSISGTANGVYEYDGNKKRVKSVVDGKTLYFVYDASGKLMIVDRPDFVTPANNERVYYLHAAGKTILRYTHRDNSSNSIDYLHADHLGSANSASGSAGTVKWREQYSPFGERLSQIAANDDLDGFTGHVFDKATGLNYMQARYYDPLIGRFLSIDPVGIEQTGIPGMFNRYAYVLNDPINGIDPDGMVPKRKIGSNFRDNGVGAERNLIAGAKERLGISKKAKSNKPTQVAEGPKNTLIDSTNTPLNLNNSSLIGSPIKGGIALLPGDSETGWEHIVKRHSQSSAGTPGSPDQGRFYSGALFSQKVFINSVIAPVINTGRVTGLGAELADGSGRVGIAYEGFTPLPVGTTTPIGHNMALPTNHVRLILAPTTGGLPGDWEVVTAYPIP